MIQVLNSSTRIDPKFRLGVFSLYAVALHTLKGPVSHLDLRVVEDISQWPQINQFTVEVHTGPLVGSKVNILVQREAPQPLQRYFNDHLLMLLQNTHRLQHVRTLRQLTLLVNNQVNINFLPESEEEELAFFIKKIEGHKSSGFIYYKVHLLFKGIPYEQTFPIYGTKILK